MSWMRFLRRSAWDDERARELEAHLDIETDENLARGMPAAEARAAARRKLGNATRVREEIYRMNTLTVLDTAWRDLKHGARLLRKSPGFATVAVLSLALGIGANTAMFQLIDAVRLRTLPIEDPDRLVEIRIANAENGRTGTFTGRHPMLTNPLFEQIRHRQQAFSGLAAWGTATFNLAAAGEARYAQGLWVNGDFFNTLRVKPLLGRLFTPGDDRRGCGAPGVVVSSAFWQRELGGDPSAVGRPLRVEGREYPILGVTPPQFFGVEVGRMYDVALPICAEPFVYAPSRLDERNVWFLGLFARLKPGWTAERASAHLAAISPPIFRDTVPPRYKPEDRNYYLAFRLATTPAGAGFSSLRRDYEMPLWLLLATTGLVLAIACANLANLMLARATAREREIAVRLAIGASRGHVIAQLVSESFLVAVLGAVAGLVLARWVSALLIGFLTTDANRVFVDLAIDWRVFAFTASLAMGTCLVFGLAPAIRATAGEPGAAMKSGSRGTTDSRERFGLRRGLVVVQVALSLVLVIGALLFVRSLRNLMTLDAGFRQDGVLAVTVDLRRTGIAAANVRAADNAIAARLRGLPGVDAAAESYIVPVSGAGWNNQIVVGGTVRQPFVNFNEVGPGYFRAMATALVAGRDFSDADSPTTPRVAIVTERFAKTFFDGASPIGRTFQVDEGAGVERPVHTIVGLVKDQKYTDLREEFTPIVFLAATQDAKADPVTQFVVRSSAPLAALTREITSAITAAHPAAILDFQTLDSVLHNSLLRERLMATLSAFFGLLAAVLATIGLYGVMSYMVERRKSEIGIRIALGADRRAVVAMVMREAATLVAAGLAVGAVVAVGGARWAAALLFGLGPRDPATLAAAAAALAVIGAIASYIPAQRAARLEPTIALREE